METSSGQHIRWKEPEVSSFPANGLHSKVNRTYSFGLPPASLLTHLSINRRSSPDGSAAEAEPGHLSTGSGRKQIDENAFLTTAGLGYDDDAKKEAIGRSQSPQPVTAAGDGPSTATVTQPYLGQNGEYACASNRDMEPSLLDLDACDAIYSPVASESRGELLQCEGGSVALEDVLRHYWLLSDRDDEPPKRRDNRGTVSDDSSTVGGFDWNSKRSEVNSPFRSPPGLSDWIVRSPEIMLPLDCDDDADSVVTLSTISEENEEDLSSTSEDLSSDSEVDSMTRIDENVEKSFGDASGDVARNDVGRDATDFFDDNDMDFLSDKDDIDAQSDLSAEMEKVIPIYDQRSLITRLPDGVEDDLLPSSSSMMDSFVRSFSHYVSDIYPFSPAFHSHESNVFVGEGNSCHTESDPSMTPAPADGYKEYTVTDTLVHIKLSLDESGFSRHKDQATNTVADQNSELFWSRNDVRSSIASPTSWYTVSDIYNSQSFETASEMAEDDSGEAAVSTANAKCTAVARCLAGHLSQPLELQPSTTVSLKVTAADPFAAIGRAAARAASQSTSRFVRDFPTSENEVVEIVVTTTCVLSRMNNQEPTESNSDEDAVFILTNDAAVETRSSLVDVATQSSIHNSFDYCDGCTAEKACDIRFPATSEKHFRNTPAIPGAYLAGAGETEDGVVEEWSSAVDEATQGSYTCSVAIPCTGPDGDVRPQVDEATYLPTATGAVTSNSASQDFEVISVAVKECARKRKVLLPEETARHKDKERGTDVVPFASYTTLGSNESLEKQKIFSNLQGSGMKAEEHFRNTLKHSGFLEKPGNTTAVTDDKDALQTLNNEKLPDKSHEDSHPLDLNPVLDKSSACAEPAIETCDDIPKSGIVSDYLDGESLYKNLLTVVLSSKSQQLESQKEDVNKAIAAYDKNIDSEDGTRLKDPETKNGSVVLRRTFHSTSPQQLISSEKSLTRNKDFRVQKSQSLLLETDIDTLEHRRTPISRKGSRSSETKSCTDLSSSRVAQYRPRSSPFSFGRGGDTIITKEALAELLSDSASAGSFVKKKHNWGSSPQTVEHCLSEPILQVSPGKESTTSRNSAGNRSIETGHLTERFSSGARWRMYRSQETVSAKKPITSSPNRTDTAKLIECYEQSPSLRRRSLHIIETTLQRRATETATVQRTQSSKTPPLSQRLSSDSTGVKRYSSSPASSSFENLVDSLLGITAVMSMGAAVSQTRSSYEHLEPLGSGKSPKNLHRSVSGTAPTYATQSNEKKTRFEMGNEARPTDETTTGPLVDISESPVHANTTARKHVHFRKAKHIFRKCHFCIDANERKSGPSTPSKSPSHETTRKKTSSKKRH